ncbi:unnamed protein product, partial [Dovyalis caffra]
NTDPSQSLPLYDLLILGASGFTGKYVVKESFKFLNVPSSPLKSLALAAHPQLCRPFRLLGETVVAACSETGCDYLDICGEPEFMERMDVKYHEKAMETDSLVVSASGFDSVPAELGWMFNSKQWVVPAAPSQIEAYLSLESDKRIVGNFATYESAVLGVANVEQLVELRRSRPKRAKPAIPGSFPPKGPMIDHQKEICLWAVKLLSADSVVVCRTLTTLTENPRGLPGVNESPEQIKKREAFWSTIKPAHFSVKLGSKTLLGILRFITVGMFISLLGRNAIERWLLLKFPSFFSLGWFRKKGPSEDEVRSASFKMLFIGRGFSDTNVSQDRMKPDMEIITRVMGPEIAYLTTPII